MARHGIGYYVRSIRDHLNRCAVWDLRGFNFPDLPQKQREEIEAELKRSFKLFRESWIDPDLDQIAKRVTKREKDSETPH
jgi:hypothetical protein